MVAKKMKMVMLSMLTGIVDSVWLMLALTMTTTTYRIAVACTAITSATVQLHKPSLNCKPLKPESPLRGFSQPSF